MTRRFNVLFLCTGNSARSIMAESIMIKVGGSKFNVYSAGSKPRATPNPMAIETLHGFGFPIEQARSKSWDQFVGADAPRMDFIFTLCDQARREQCDIPVDRAITSHWSMEDPSAVNGEAWEIARAFNEVFGMLRRRIEIFAALPVEALDRSSLQSRVDEIARTKD
jgi:arsenate reductase